MNRLFEVLSAVGLAALWLVYCYWMVTLWS